MLIYQQVTGGPWLCLNEITGAEIQFADVTAVSRFGTAINSGVEGLYTQLGTGSIFPSCDNPASVNAVWEDFFVSDNYVSMIGWSAAGEEGMMAGELVEGAETLSEAVVESGGVGEWILLILGLAPMVSNNTRSDNIDISRAKPPYKIRPENLPRIFALRKKSKKVSKPENLNEDDIDLQQIAVSVATHSIQWMNALATSGDSITISSWGINGGVFQHLTVSPDPAGTVVPFNGTETIGWYDGLVVGEPESNGWIILSLPNAQVGVEIHEPGRFADIGTPPYYLIYYTGIEGGVWVKPVNDPSEKYVFPRDIVGCKITVTPQATAETLSVVVTIQAS